MRPPRLRILRDAGRPVTRSSAQRSMAVRRIIGRFPGPASATSPRLAGIKGRWAGLPRRRRLAAGPVPRGSGTVRLEDAFHAATRFGLGPKPGELARLRSDPRGWLKEQLRDPLVPDLVRTPARGRAGTHLVGRALTEPGTPGAERRRSSPHRPARRFRAHVRTEQPFYERQVMFWSNHFTVSVRRPVVSGLVNAYEVEAIRPYVA